MTRALTPPDWEQAVCRSTSPDDFFPEQPGKQPALKRLCGSCVLKDACLQYALDNDEKWGIWGGLGPKARRKLRAA